MAKSVKSKAAALLGAMGGKARAANMTSEQRSDVARKASEARWRDHERPIRATHSGVLRFGDVEVGCANLPGDLRVVSHTAFVEALGRARPGAQTYQRREDSGRDHLPIFLALKCLKPFIPHDFSIATIAYVPANGGKPAMGIDARAIPSICRVWIDALAADVLRDDQKPTAQRANTILAALGELGIVALIDEVTGYQQERASTALAEILERFVAKELARWARAFDLDYYKHLCRLKGIAFDELSSARPQCLGVITNNIVYRRLAPGVLAELENRNPVQDNGRRRSKHHQWLTPAVGHPALREHIAKVTALMAISETWDEFMLRLDRVAPKIGDTLPLALPIASMRVPQHAQYAQDDRMLSDGVPTIQ